MLDDFSTITITQPVSLSTHTPTLPPAADSGEDRSDHAFHILQNGGVSKAQNFEAMRGQHTRPLAIPPLGLVRIMLAAIGFDHEATPQTAEVGDKGTNRDLPPEMGSLQLDPMAQRPPEPLFGWRHRGAHALGEEALGWRGPEMSGLAWAMRCVWRRERTMRLAIPSSISRIATCERCETVRKIAAGTSPPS